MRGVITGGTWRHGEKPEAVEAMSDSIAEQLTGSQGAQSPRAPCWGKRKELTRVPPQNFAL